MSGRLRAALAAGALASMLVATPSAALLTPLVSIDFESMPLGPIPEGDYPFGVSFPGPLGTLYVPRVFSSIPGLAPAVVAEAADGNTALTYGPVSVPPGFRPPQYQQGILAIGAGYRRYLVEANLWIDAVSAQTCEPVPKCLISTGFSFFVDGPEALGLRYQADGVIRSTLQVDVDPGSGDRIFRTLGRYEVGEMQRVRAIVDLDEQTTRISVNGREIAVFDHEFGGRDLNTVRFGTQRFPGELGNGWSARVDDIFVAAFDDPSDLLVPEPSTALLVGIGLVGIAARRRAA